MTICGAGILPAFSLMRSVPACLMATAILISGARAAEVRFLADATCSGEVVRLGDVAQLYGKSSGECETLAQVELFAAPAAGASKVVRLRTVQDILHLRGVVLGSHRFGGATQITIRRPAPQRVRSSRILKGQERVATGEIKAAIAGYLRTVAGDADGWEIEVMLTEKQIRRIVAARGRFTVRGGATPWVGRQRFEVHFGSTDDAAEIVLAEVRLPESVVVAVRDLPRGVVVGRSDVTLVSDQKSVGRVERFHSIDDVVGMETKQPIAHGQPVATASVQPPVLVRQGDSVTVYALGDGIQIRTYGRARQSGSRGDNVWIESMTDRTRYLAEVVSAGVVKIGDNRPAFSDDVRATRKALNTPGGRQPTTGTSR